jgi:AcrR family transcriptional regulator
MNSPDSFTRDRILDVASLLVKEFGAYELQFADVAEKADVDVDTVEYFFDSVAQLRAEAQLSNYFTMIEPHHRVLVHVEEAVDERDESSFWSAVEANVELAWSSGQVGDKWGLIRLLQDIWSDPFSQNHFCELLDLQFQRWIEVIEGAQSLGWVEPDIDAKAMVSVFWSASVGQVITAGSTVLDLTPQASRDFLMRIVRGRSHQGSALSS